MPAWLTARPLAHRGLHDPAGPVENTASAFTAAIAADYGIECDLQISADGEAMVYHDVALGRLTDGTARLADLSSTELKRVSFKATADRMLTLGELCDLVAGRVTLLVELKSRFDGDLRLAQRTAQVLSQYQGPVAAMSFDPEPVAALRHLSPRLTRGLVAQRRDSEAHRENDTPPAQRPSHYMRHAFAAGLQFLAYRVKDLPSALPLFTRSVLRLPLLTWTVRTAEDRARAARWADQIIFEGFRP
ncbi:MAG TPA: glycerophosphodiester phosphodiesterase family protein [Xanthobacteraceae bacterium]|nr:glycerophosphodiester phosphodiesterase family protein [Xanthobacteraceae bacterium]